MVSTARHTHWDERERWAGAGWQKERGRELVVLSYIIGLYKNGITYLFIIFSRLMKTI